MIRLHGYWRSTASYRIRIALNLKGVAFQQVTYDLRRGEQRGETYRRLQPQGLVPALETEDGVLVQSPAILEWLEERHPDPPLLPADPAGRAAVRAIAAIVACDIHPLNNLRVLTSLHQDLDADEAQVNAWIARWIASGFAAVETLISTGTGHYAFGDLPGLADVMLVPQLYSAERFGVDLAPYPRIRAAGGAARALAAFHAAAPDQQPDADPG